ncbi:MAG: efflux RND transporter periplasmic adaptor subunit [Chlamydiae bacterium]|nr:efflux RND transporter periplasmic adaptor subunit [Chlamydiota bacterium]
MKYLPLICLFLVGCTKKTEQAQQSIPVSALRIEPQNIPANFEFVAVAESSHIVELRARVEGYLEKITYKEGSMVESNAPLFTLDQRQFIDSLNEQKALLAQREAVLWRAEQQEQRMTPLYIQNAVSQMDYDNAIANSLAASADVQLSQASVMKAEVELSYTQINAPVAGMVGKAVFREGALISPGPNSLLANLYVIDPIWVNFSVSDNDLLKARRETCQKRLVFPPRDEFIIEITLADGTVMPSKGSIDFLSPAIEQNTGTMLVRAVLPNPEGILRPGLFVKATVKGAMRPNAILVPQEAVMMGQNGIFVFVISEDGLATLRPVEVGDWYGNYWIINNGLNPGDIVIGKGVSRVMNHSKVKVNSWLEPVPVIEETQKTICE